MLGVAGVQAGGSLAGNDSSEASSTSSSWWTWRSGSGRFGSGLGSGTVFVLRALESPGDDRRATLQNCQPAITNNRQSGSSGKNPKSAVAVSLRPAGR